MEHHDTLTGPVQIVFAHGTFLAKKTARDEGASKQLRRLAHNLPNCHLPEFVRVYGSVSTQAGGATRAVLTELCPLTLHEFIHALQFQPPKEVMASMALDIANAVLYLHQHNMLHGDLVPSAILVSTSCNCKIGDLGAPPPPNNAYTAPEVRAGGPLTSKSDVYALGMTTLELATGLPTAKVPLPELLEELEWEPLRLLLERCVAEAPGARPDAKDVVEELKKLLASLDAPTPYPLLEFRMALCQRLKAANKLMFFPDLYWATEMAEEHAAAARGEALPLQLGLEHRLTKVELAVGHLQEAVDQNETKVQGLQVEMGDLRGSGSRRPSGGANGRISPASPATLSEALSPSPSGTPSEAPVSGSFGWDGPPPPPDTVLAPATSPLQPYGEGPYAQANGGHSVPGSIDGSPAVKPAAVAAGTTSPTHSSAPTSGCGGGENGCGGAATVKVDRGRLKTVQADQVPWFRVPPNKEAALRYADAVDDEFCCSMCLEVMENASCLTRCGHSFCQACLKRAIQRKPECPQCRQQGEDCVPNFTLRKLIASLSVRCAHEGCAAVMPRSDLDAHVLKCPNGPHKCNVPNSSDPHDWCSFTCGSEAERVQHRQRCDYVLVQCPHGCGDQFSAKLLSAHERSCLAVPLQCPDCGASMSRGEFAEHLCPNEEIQCELCQKALTRRQLGDHMEEAAKEHVNQLVSTVAQQNKLLRELRGMVLEQKARMDDHTVRLASAVTPKTPSLQAVASAAGPAGLRVTWHAQMLKAYALYESPVFMCHGHAFSIRLSKPPAPEAPAGHSHMLSSRSRSSSATSSVAPGSADWYGLFLRSLNDVGVIVNWTVACGAFRGSYNHFFQDKNAEAGTDHIIAGADGQRLVVELTLRVGNVILEGGDRKNTTLEKYHERRRRRTVLEPGKEEERPAHPPPPFSPPSHLGATTLRVTPRS